MNNKHLFSCLLAAGVSSAAVAAGTPVPLNQLGITTAQTPSAPAPAFDKAYLDKRFDVRGNEVYDRKADLTWQRCDYGMTWDDANGWCKGVRKLMTIEGFEADVKANQKGWRVPEAGELLSLMEVACVHGTKESVKDVVAIFPDVSRNSFYLSVTPHTLGETNEVVQCMGTAMTAGLSRKYVSVTRLVHSGPPQAEAAQ